MTENVKFFKLVRDILTDKIIQLIPEKPHHIAQELNTDQKFYNKIKPTIKKAFRKQANKS